VEIHFYPWAILSTALARRAFGGTVHALCKGRRTMACTITSLFLIAMFGIVAAGMVFRPSTKERSHRLGDREHQLLRPAIV
jgi:hypothetical protein